MGNCRVPEENLVSLEMAICVGAGAVCLPLEPYPKYFIGSLWLVSGWLAEEKMYKEYRPIAEPLNLVWRYDPRIFGEMGKDWLPYIPDIFVWFRLN